MSQKRRFASIPRVPCIIMPLATCGPLRRCFLRPASVAPPAVNGQLTGVNPDEGPQLSYRIGYKPHSDQGDYQYGNRGDMDL